MKSVKKIYWQQYAYINVSVKEFFSGISCPKDGTDVNI